MKNILVEFTDHGAIVHKDPSIIAAKRDLPYCFFNPELSKVAGVSPSYWVCNSDKEIVPASPEERKRRDEYHDTKPPENTVSFKQTMDELLDEVYEDLEKNIEDLQCINEQIVNTLDIKTIELQYQINKNTADILMLLTEKDELFRILAKQEKETKLIKIAIGCVAILSIILKLI